jgi:hypothetical protein
LFPLARYIFLFTFLGDVTERLGLERSTSCALRDKAGWTHTHTGPPSPSPPTLDRTVHPLHHHHHHHHRTTTTSPPPHQRDAPRPCIGIRLPPLTRELPKHACCAHKNKLAATSRSSTPPIPSVVTPVRPSERPAGPLLDHQQLTNQHDRATAMQGLDARHACSHAPPSLSFPLSVSAACPS